MSLRDLVHKYICSAEHVLGRIRIVEVPVEFDVGRVREVVDSAKAYLEDARYYREKEKFEVSLTSVAYCEGLLDALRTLGMVKFEWPAKKRKRKNHK